MAKRGSAARHALHFLFSGLPTDPTQVLSEKITEWCGIWKCNDTEAREKACRVVRKAMSDALQAGDYDGAPATFFSGPDSARAASSFRANTSAGGDCWPLREYAMVYKEDLARFSAHAARPKSQCTTPMQYLVTIMSMTPKKR